MRMAYLYACTSVNFSGAGAAATVSVLVRRQRGGIRRPPRCTDLPSYCDLVPRAAVEVFLRTGVEALKHSA